MAKTGQNAENATNVGDKSLSGKRIVVNAVDTSEKDVLFFDERGATLIFMTRVGEFLKLSDEGLVKLSKWNRDRYNASAEIARVEEDERRDDKVDDMLSGLSFDANRGSATERLAIAGKDPNFRYWWEVPERVFSKVQAGWEVVSSGTEKTIHSNGTRIHKIGKRGEEELVLMRIPVAKMEQRNASKVEQYNSHVRALKEQPRAAFRKAGSPDIDDATDRRVSYRDIRDRLRDSDASGGVEGEE